MTEEKTRIEKKFLKIETPEPDSILEIVYFLNKYSGIDLKNYKKLKVIQDTSTIAIYDLATEKLENLTKFLVNSKTVYEVLGSKSERPYFGYLEIPQDLDDDIENFIKNIVIEQPENKCDGRICESISNPKNTFTLIEVTLDMIGSKIIIREGDKENLYEINLENLDKFNLDSYCIPHRKECLDETVDRFIEIARHCDIKTYNRLSSIRENEEQYDVFKESFWKNLDKFLESKMEEGIELTPMVGCFKNLVEFYELIKIAVKSVERKFVNKFEIPVQIDGVVSVKGTSYEDAVEILKELLECDVKVKIHNRKITIKDLKEDDC